MQIKLDGYPTLFLWELLSGLISAPESKQHDFVRACSCRKNAAALKVEMFYSLGKRPGDSVTAWTLCSSAAEDTFALQEVCWHQDFLHFFLYHPTFQQLRNNNAALSLFVWIINPVFQLIHYKFEKSKDAAKNDSNLDLQSYTKKLLWWE